MSEWAIKCAEMLTTKQQKQQQQRETNNNKNKTSYFIQCYFELKARIKPDTPSRVKERCVAGREKGRGR